MLKNVLIRMAGSMLWLVIPLVLISSVLLLVIRRRSRKKQAERKLRREGKEMYPLW